MATQRNIYTVHAHIVDANGTKNVLTGYPKDFDSKNFVDEAHPLPDGNTDKALKRAMGELSEVKGAFCKRDDRMIQTVFIVDVYGNKIDRFNDGTFPIHVPEPEPEEEPEEQE